MRMSKPVVEATDLVLGYQGVIALDRSTFTIPSGKVTAVIGPNGSGKSTLLNAIAGLVEPISGSLWVVPGARVAYVLQTTKVNDALPISVGEVVAMGRFGTAGAYGRLGEADRRAIQEAMERTGIAHLSMHSLHELSGGQRQRVFVAQGLAQEHDILLLDEPLTGIDLTTAMAIDEIVHEEVAEGGAVVITTHDLSEAGAADYVLLLSGRVVASGPPSEVLAPDHLVDAYGAALLHVDGDRIFLDDAAHDPADRRHVHRERSIHTESSLEDTHGE